MIFGQLSNRESLRALIVAMEAHAGELYHLGIGKSVTRSNLSKANEQNGTGGYARTSANSESPPSLNEFQVRPE